MFNKRYPNKLEVISDISLNAEFYYPNNSNDRIIFSQIDKYSMKITKFICGESFCVLYLIGPKGSSKSIFLMYTSFKNNIRQTPTFYINYRKMKYLEIKQRKDIFKKEMIYLFLEEKTPEIFTKKIL